jgi:hypothetical protein
MTMPERRGSRPRPPEAWDPGGWLARRRASWPASELAGWRPGGVGWLAGWRAGGGGSIDRLVGRLVGWRQNPLNCGLAPGTQTGRRAVPTHARQISHGAGCGPARRSARLKSQAGTSGARQVHRPPPSHITRWCRY